MVWWSILPPQLTQVETWIVRFFLFVGILIMGPWVLVLAYDLLLYIFRAITHEVPYIGGRARGRQRPRVPSLAERPNGRPRTFSVTGTGTSSDVTSSGDGDVRRRSRNKGHTKSLSSEAMSGAADEWEDGEEPIMVEQQ